MKKHSEKHFARRRLSFQIAAAALINGYAMGFAKGKIFTGSSKMFCVPVLNCYSCPAALGACPVGALQSIIGSARYDFSFYVVGLIMLFGLVLGRLICGLLCPFGLVQDLLYKIPLPKIRVNPRIDRPLRFLKYIVGAVFVVLLPLFLTNQFGTAPPYFCKLICPAGILEGAFPLIAANPSLRSSLGFLFNWKLFVLVAVLVSSVFIYRPFCKYLCPLGAFYSLFNRFSLYGMYLDKSLCINCKACERKCLMNVELTKNINSPECIRCGACKSVCPKGAISSGFDIKIKPIKTDKKQGHSKT
ncbi:MAG: 4Fe-4S binding protein [Clostridiales bacterium]|nr:4Fe-4S binding protein [Clostridiales bacterium]